MKNDRERDRAWTEWVAGEARRQAQDTVLDRDVAFALIKTEKLDDEARRRASSAKAHAMGRLGDHPNIVAIFEFVYIAVSRSRQTQSLVV